MELKAVVTSPHSIGVILVTLIWVIEGWKPFFVHSKPRFRHDVENLIVGLFNFGLVGVVFMSCVSMITQVSKTQGFGLLNVLSLTPWVEVILAILLFDLWMYVWHRRNHETPILWRFHRFHHVDEEMNSTTSFRFHTCELIISSVLKLGVILLLGMSLWQFVVYELILLPVIAFHHSNIAIPRRLDDILRWVVASPNMHKVHHSDIVEETNSNYGSILSCWDRLFGTSTYVEDVDRIVYGVSRG